MWEDVVNHPKLLTTINASAGTKLVFFTFAPVVCNISISNSGISEAFRKSDQ